MAKLADQAERYEEMMEFMEKVSAITDGEELSVEERNLLSVAYKNVIGARRASWRIISSVEHKEKSRGNDDHVATIRDYKSKIEMMLRLFILEHNFQMIRSFSEIFRLLWELQKG